MPLNLMRALLLSAGIAIALTVLYHFVVQDLKDRKAGKQLNLEFYKAAYTVQIGVDGNASEVPTAMGVIAERLKAANYKYQVRENSANSYTYTFERLQDTMAIPALLTGSSRLRLQEIYSFQLIAPFLLQADTALAGYLLAHPQDSLLQLPGQPLAFNAGRPLFSLFSPATVQSDGYEPGYAGTLPLKDTAFVRQLLEHSAAVARLPANCRFMYESARDYALLYAIRNQPSRISNRNIVETRAQLDAYSNSPSVYIKLDAFGGVEFERLTRENVGRCLAICINDQVISAPRVNGEIKGGSLVVTMGAGKGGMRDAEALAVLLTGKELPLPVHIRHTAVAKVDGLTPKPGYYAAVFCGTFLLALVAQWLIRRLTAS